MVKRIILFFVVFFGSAAAHADDIFQTWGIYVAQERVTGHVPDFRNQLQKAWQLKCSRECTEEAKDMAARVVQRYPKHPKALSLSEYVSFMDREASKVKEGLQWNDLQKHYRLSDEQRAFLISLVGKIHGRELAAYALTELMPSKNGILNREALATLLAHAGQEYIELLPAIYDPYVSFGPFQPTQFALYEGADEFRGASVTNTFIPDRSVKIPGSKEGLITAWQCFSRSTIWRISPSMSIPVSMWPPSHPTALRVLSPAVIMRQAPVVRPRSSGSTADRRECFP